MKFNTRYTRLALICVATSFTLIGLMAWTDRPTGEFAQNFTDTIPSKKMQKEKEKKDFDKELKELEKAEKELRAFDNDDWDEISDQIEAAIGRIDFGRIGLEFEDATKNELKDLDKQIERSMKDINWNELNDEIEKSMQEVRDIDFEKLREEIQDSKGELNLLKNGEWQKKFDAIDWKELNADIAGAMKDVKDLDFNFDFDKKGFDLDFHFEATADDLRKAKEELLGFKEMVYEMEEDKLLNTEKDYTIEFKKGELFINQKKQSDQVTAKYKKYFKNDLRIIKENGNININSQSNKKRSTIDPA